MDHFLLSHQNFNQNSNRNSKIGVLKILVKKWQKIARFGALKSIFEFNDNIGYFNMFQGFKKATPHGGARKLRLTLPPVHCVSVNWFYLFNDCLFSSDFDGRSRRVSRLRDSCHNNVYFGFNVFIYHVISKIYGDQVMALITWIFNLKFSENSYYLVINIVE